MNILYVSKIPVFPVNSGSKLRIYGLLYIFNELGYKVSAIVGTFKDDLSKSKLKNVTYIKHKFKLFHQVFPFIRERVISDNYFCGK